MTNKTEIQYHGRDYRVYRNNDGKISRVTVFLPEWENKPGTWQGVPLSNAVVVDLDRVTRSYFDRFPSA